MSNYISNIIKRHNNPGGIQPSLPSRFERDSGRSIMENDELIPKIENSVENIGNPVYNTIGERIRENPDDQGKQNQDKINSETRISTKQSTLKTSSSSRLSESTKKIKESDNSALSKINQNIGNTIGDSKADDAGSNNLDSDIDNIAASKPVKDRSVRSNQLSNTPVPLDSISRANPSEIEQEKIEKEEIEDHSPSVSKARAQTNDPKRGEIVEQIEIKKGNIEFNIQSQQTANRYEIRRNSKFIQEANVIKQEQIRDNPQNVIQDQIVHINIGRIEVRGIHKPGPKISRPPVSNNTSNTLNDYLKQRDNE